MPPWLVSLRDAGEVTAVTRPLRAPVPLHMGRHRAGWMRPCALMAKSQTHRRNEEGPSSWLAANLSH
jgi:hypothetical protein